MKKSLLYIAMIAVLFSCRKDETVGPELRDIFGDFEVIQPLTVNQTNVDFETGQSIEFSAQLSIRTDRTIHINGLESGARKEITGRDRDVNGAVARWRGDITFAPLFQAEECEIFMTFADYPDTLFAENVTVDQIKPQAEVTVLVSDFATPAGWGTFAEAAAVNQHIDGTYFVQDPQVEPPSFIEVGGGEGTGHWRMTHNNQSNVFICGINYLSGSIEGATGPHLELGTTNPENVYMNMLIHGFGDGNTRFSVGLQEDDNLDGSYDRFTEGTYNTEILVNWVGWKVVSIPLSDFNLSTVGGFGNIDGTGQQDIDRIVSMEFLLLAAEGSTGFVGYGLDYVNFTQFTPWNP